jgi:hypothetical protein
MALLSVGLVKWICFVAACAVIRNCRHGFTLTKMRVFFLDEKMHSP